MFSSITTVKHSLRKETNLIVAGLEIQFLLWVARVKITRLKYTIVDDGSERFLEKSLLKRDYPPDFGNNFFLTAELSFRSESYLIVAGVESNFYSGPPR